MSEEQVFRDLVERARRGDADAATELLRTYEPHIRRVVRVKMTDTSMRRVMDSMDVCQSVMANFFVRVAAGQFDLNNPQDLIKLLVRMTQNKIYDHVRRQQADRRDRRRETAGNDEALQAVADRGATPSVVIANRELLEKVRGRLTKEERYLAEQRALGREWSELAAELGKGAEALRKQYSRAMDRVAQELGLDDSGLFE